MMEKIRVLQRSRKMIGNADGPFKVGMGLSKDAKAQKLAYSIGLKRRVGIWRWRKDIAFTGKETTLPGKIEQMNEYSKEINMAFANLQHGRNVPNNQDVILSWQPP
nr:hypothetical protein Iba_scaffold13492CG0240 [Ipomoea batatas]